MYDIISGIIAHSWVNNYTSDQQYIFYICGAMLLILTVAFIDVIKTIFAAFLRK